MSAGQPWQHLRILSTASRGIILPIFSPSIRKREVLCLVALRVWPDLYCTILRFNNYRVRPKKTASVRGRCTQTHGVQTPTQWMEQAQQESSEVVGNLEERTDEDIERMKERGGERAKVLRFYEPGWRRKSTKRTSLPIAIRDHFELQKSVQHVLATQMFRRGNDETAKERPIW